MHLHVLIKSRHFEKGKNSVSLDTLVLLPASIGSARHTTTRNKHGPGTECAR